MRCTSVQLHLFGNRTKVNKDDKIVVKSKSWLKTMSFRTLPNLAVAETSPTSTPKLITQHLSEAKSR